MNNSKKIINYFYWNISWVLLIILLVLSAYCILVWYQYVYHPRWSGARIEDYMRSKSTEIAKFDQSGFQMVMDEKKTRETDYAKTFNNVGDIFQLKTVTTAKDTKQK